MTQLDSIRSEFNLLIKLACKESALTEIDFENLGFVEFAKLISNPLTKENYLKLASKLLEENIRALHSDNQHEHTAEWTKTLLQWCKAKEELQHN